MSRSTGYVFDDMNRMVRIDYPNATQAGFDHDNNGNVTLFFNENAEVAFAYDEMNRLAASTQSVSSVNFVVQNSFDLNGNRTNITYPGGLVVSYSFDEDNRLTSASAKNANGTYTFSFGYDGASRLTGISYPNGINATVGYDAESRVTNYVHGTVLNHVITRDLRGFKTREDIYAGLIPSFTNGLRQTRAHNDADQLLSAGDEDYAYDANGNLTNASGTTYEWDYDNRLLRFGHTEYSYDASGGRVERVENGTTNFFVLDYADPLKRPLAEVDGAGTITQYYIWRPAGLLAHIEANGAVYYYHQNEQGSTLALTDTNAAVVAQYAYSPHGEILQKTGSVETPYTFIGGFGVRAENSDTYYMLNRYYSVSQRRFLSIDPAGIDSFANLYVYGNLNPLFGVDPTGLLTVFVHGTYSDSSTFNQATRNIYAETFNDQNQISFEWSGMNNTLARKIAGRRLAGNINEYRTQYPNEPITIVSHSHGGNVAFEASKRAGIDNLVTLGTPARTFTHNPNESNIGEWYNVYSHGDKVQVSGGGLFQPFFQEAGPAGRTFSGAHNIETKHSSGWVQTHLDLTGRVGADAVGNYMNRPAK
ncbi:RHS repeat domain-containing protein [Kiritimatiella glycovorans]|nr:RHS repeat-associated core domain-containing protein [Kiritimatiella glycovorans]